MTTLDIDEKNEDIIEKNNKIFKYTCYKCNNYQTNVKQNLFKHMTNKKNPCNQKQTFDHVIADKLRSYIKKYDQFLENISDKSHPINEIVRDWRNLYIMGIKIKNVLNDESQEELYNDFVKYHQKISNFNF